MLMMPQLQCEPSTAQMVAAPDLDGLTVAALEEVRALMLMIRARPHEVTATYLSQMVMSATQMRDCFKS